MNIEQLRNELEIDEGVKYEIYLDHLGLPTFGIGHLVTENDPEQHVRESNCGQRVISFLACCYTLPLSKVLTI